MSQSPDVVDHFVNEAVNMGMKWVVFLNEGANIGANDYLVHQLTQAKLEPVMRVYTPGLTPIGGDLESMVHHYSDLGVRYFQLYNEPNLMVETNGQYPDADRYLDLWLPAAQQVVAGGGLPGIGALSPKEKLMIVPSSLQFSITSKLVGRKGCSTRRGWRCITTQPTPNHSMTLTAF